MKPKFALLIAEYQDPHTEPPKFNSEKWNALANNWNEMPTGEKQLRIAGNSWLVPLESDFVIFTSLGHVLARNSIPFRVFFLDGNDGLIKVPPDVEKSAQGC